MNAKVVEVTPDKAQRMLEKCEENIEKGVFRQRTISENTVKAYASTMKLGAWLLNGEPIVIDSRSNILNGRHRLAAVVEAGIPVKFLLITEMNDQDPKGYKLIDTYDACRVRSIGSQLGIAHGMSNGGKIAAFCRNIAVLGWAAKKLDVPKTLEIAKMFSEELEEILALWASDRESGQSKSMAVWTPMLLYRKSSQASGTKFCKLFFYREGDGWNKNSPIYALNNWVSQGRDFGMSCVGTASCVASAIHAFDQGRTMTAIKQSDRALEWLLHGCTVLNDLRGKFSLNGKG